MTNTQPTRLVRWPVEATVREECREQGIACVLVVEGSAGPPRQLHPSEDWVRAPISRQDLDARVAALHRRAYGCPNPEVDDAGLLHFRTKSVLLSCTQGALMAILIDRYEEVVSREELGQCLAANTPDVSRNALDLHIMRLRKRVDRVGLGIETAWRRGYLLTSVDTGLDSGLDAGVAAASAL